MLHTQLSMGSCLPCCPSTIDKQRCVDVTNTDASAPCLLRRATWLIMQQQAGPGWPSRFQSCPWLRTPQASFWAAYTAGHCCAAAAGAVASIAAALLRHGCMLQPCPASSTLHAAQCTAAADARTTNSCYVPAGACRSSSWRAPLITAAAGVVTCTPAARLPWPATQGQPQPTWPARPSAPSPRARPRRHMHRERTAAS